MSAEERLNRIRSAADAALEAHLSRCANCRNEPSVHCSGLLDEIVLGVLKEASPLAVSEKRMSRVDYLLACLAEECNELGQRCTKALRFGMREVQPGQPLMNSERLRAEAADLFAVLDMLREESQEPLWPLEIQVRLKKLRVNDFMEYSESLGRLEKKA